MAKYSGNAGVIKAITSTGTPAAVGEIISFGLSTSAATIDATALGDASREYLAGIKDATVNFEAHYDPADAAQVDLAEGEGVDFELLPESGNKVTGSGIVTSVDVNVAMDETVKVSGTIQVSGGITRAAVT